MNRLRQPGDSHYDVLGLSPGASDEEIESVFRQLIDGQGYKVGVPLNRQWLRARQIKDAHAALADPATRQAYDESLGRTPEPAPWVLSAHDPATDKLVMPKEEPPATAATDSPPASSKPGPTPEPATDEIGQLADDRQPQADPAAFNDNESGSTSAIGSKRLASVRTWGLATAVASALGLVILSTWPGSNRPSSLEGPLETAEPARQASEALLGFVRQAPGNSNRAVNAQPQAAAGTSPVAESDGASLERIDHEASQFATRVAADGQPQARPASAGSTPAGASSQSVDSVEARATAPAPPPPAVPEPAVATAVQTVATESSARMAHSPPQWVGGGPTDADNRRGRYQGSLTVQVSVEANGSVSKCAPVRGSGNAALDEMTCRLVRERARFTPALDAQGRPVAAQAYTTFVWGRNRWR